ncbi:pentatricopeptide repeat-containing protein At3g49170, chloroplastic-like [Coffea arabica]|uniref:Pentatricopeptide repeat-containing protein At3g49170, chloroplastic-like n=1 Tax=Coffea arabica TaxID=13443 RepID=A0A6P6VLK5_COFAR|nr:pentatricopeptide repeat-containing protein At3g49170, chloroplastic-like [Coffea arabica]
MTSLSSPSPAKLFPLQSPIRRPRTPPSHQSLSPTHHRKTKPKFEALKDNLIRHADAGDIKRAISTLDFMARNGLTPDLTSYSVLLKFCIRTRNFHLGKLIHSKILGSKLQLDSIVLNSLISLYSKNGDWLTARNIFETMGEKRDLVSWSAIISCFAHSNMELEAIFTFFDMVEHGEHPNQFCFSAAIQACSNVKYASIGLVIFGIVIKSGYFGSDVCVGCALIDLFSKGFHDLNLAKKVFDQMPLKNSVSWTLMITRISQISDPASAVQLFLEMVLTGFVPDKFTFSSVLSACAELEWLSFGQQLHSSALKSGLSSDVCVGCSLVDMYAKSTADGSMSDSRKVFDRMPVHNVMSWTAIITGYVQGGGDDWEAISLYRMMMEEGSVKPNHFTFSALLKACGNLTSLGMGKIVYGHAVKLGLAYFDCVGNALISLYARCDKLEDARRAFEVLFQKNLVSFNTIVDAYAKNFKSDEAFELFSGIEDSGVVVDAFTYASLLSGAAIVGAVGKGEQIHARLLKAGFESNEYICNSLISMYSRCGNIEAASQVFRDMSDQSIISWTAMITGFAKHGFAERALELFTAMLSAGIKPNEVTYVAVLSACSHAGMTDEGWKYFHSMSEEHGISPRMEHYACMVDLLGRSGFLDRAVELIKSMPFVADALVWRTLLGACQVHGNVELGKHAAEIIHEQDPDDPAARVLLSNLYASSGQWEKVANIRKGMRARNLVKEAGCSWIEAENKVHKFYVGDTEHPQAKEIYKELDRLAVKIKEMGYVPNTNFVLHEAEEEQKEQYLFQHSEKLAVAFGLISTFHPKPIRIFKNLRVCGDCHSALKYISLATGREILVRDSNRFHHINNGICSCNDYW